MNSRKATGPGKIPWKIVKILANIIDCHLINIINRDLKRNSISDSTKVASIRPILKRTKIKKYGPVSILNCFSKDYQRLIQKKTYVNSD